MNRLALLHLPTSISSARAVHTKKPTAQTRILATARVSSTASTFQSRNHQQCNSPKIHPTQQSLIHGPIHVRGIHLSTCQNSSKHTYSHPYPWGPAASPDTMQMTPTTLTDILNKKRDILTDELGHRKVQTQAVFTNSELSLKHVDVYGFDFDYTLLQYTPEVHKLIYQLARKRLVEKLSYPHGIEDMPYNPDFVIRGLHCDVRRGLLMKIDAYNHIHLSSVHRGHQPVSKGEVLGMYGGTHVPLRVTEQSHDSKMVQFLDLFSIPEATLFADVMEYVSQREKQKLFPKYLFEDVQHTVKEIHTEGLIHDAIIEDIERYTKTTPRLPEFLGRLKNAGKKLFLITNSPYWFVNAGLTHALGSSHWRELFDIVIVQAMKPSFYSNNSDRPFRLLHPQSLNQTWKPVSSLERSQTYIQGNVRDFIRMTGWTGYRVLYFGDHVFSDLADPIMQLGWKTGAIIPELKTEMEKAGSPEAKRYLAEMLALENMLNNYKNQEYSTPELVTVMDEWKKQRTEARRHLKVMFNPRFGSVFRTEKSPSYFSLRLSTFANLYMASLDNLMNYSLDYTFIPRRTALPHELDLNFDLDLKLDNQDL